MATEQQKQVAWDLVVEANATYDSLVSAWRTAANAKDDAGLVYRLNEARLNAFDRLARRLTKYDRMAQEAR